MEHQQPNNSGHMHETEIASSVRDETVAMDEIQAAITAELDQVSLLEKELSELRDTNLRLIAEMQNTTRRAQDEAKKSRDYAISSFAKEVITIKDYLEMALKDQSGNFEMLKMGVDLTLQQLIRVFEAHQIKDINPQAKEKLDANLHQAMTIIEEHTQEANTIVSVLQRGYLLNGRVLRPAMVTVAK